MPREVSYNLNRRGILKHVATGAVTLGLGSGAVAAGGGSGSGKARSIIGTETKQGTKKAQEKADSVHRTLSFGDLGEAVVGTFPKAAQVGLQKRSDVRYVEAEGQMQAIGQTVPWGVDRVDADVVHDDGFTGADGDIAILDTGIDSDHSDLEANLGAGKSFIGCDSGCTSNSCHNSWDDDNGHGTHCAGIANAVNNSSGVVGVSTEATLHGVKVLDCDGYGSYSDIAAGVKHAADQGWDVASMSLGGGSSSYALKDACQYAANNGTLVVAAAGNSGPCSDCVMYPAKYDSTIAVSATDGTDGLASFSSTGPEIDIAAPGASILSTVPGGTATYSGTSMACPHVSGAAGVLMANGYTGSEARAALQDNAEDIGLSSSDSGNGLLDTAAALGSDTTAPSAPTNLTELSKTDSTVDLTWDAPSDDGTGVDHYNVYLDGSKEAEASSTSATVSGLSNGTASEFSVTAVDSAGTESAQSQSVTVSTLGNPVVDATAAGDASFSGGSGDYTIEAGGIDVWSSDDDYAAVYEDDVSGDVVAQVTVESQENTHPWAKAGIMVANDITADGSSKGDLILATTPENGYALQWDSDGDGFVASSTNVDSTTYPAELRLTKSGSEFTGEYSTDGGSTWTTVGMTSIADAQTAQDIGVFIRGSKSTDTKGTVEFSGFDVGAQSADRPTVDTTAAGDATFSGGSGDYTIKGGGMDVWNSDDDYAAVYEDDVSGDVVAQVTVESQENTHQWAKAGIMVANDITADGSSKGDLILAATPENGYALQWDDDGDGYVDSSTNVDSITYPAELRLTKSGSEFAGEYSTDGGSTWTTVSTVSIADAQTAQDIGVFIRGSKSTDTKGTVEFSGFNLS